MGVDATPEAFWRTQREVRVIVGDKVNNVVGIVGNPVGLVIVFVFQEHDVFSADLEPGGIRKVPDDVVLVAVMIAIVIAVDLDTDDYLSTSELLILHTGAGAKRVRRKGRASRV